MVLVAVLLTAQRWLTGLIGLVAFFGGSLYWGPLGALWVAVMLGGLLCLAAGSFLHEFDLRHKTNHEITGLATDCDANAVKVSGIAYLAVSMVAGWFGAAFVFVACLAAVLDFLSGHVVARSLVAKPTVPDVPFDYRLLEE